MNDILAKFLKGLASFVQHMMLYFTGMSHGEAKQKAKQADQNEKNRGAAHEYAKNVKNEMGSIKPSNSANKLDKLRNPHNDSTDSWRLYFSTFTRGSTLAQPDKARKTKWKRPRSFIYLLWALFSLFKKTRNMERCVWTVDNT